MIEPQKESNFPSIHWEKFFSKFKQIDTLPISEWKETHLLAYFCKRYQGHYGISYTFKFNSTSPTKSYEMFRIRSLIQMISADPAIIKDYIDWFFERKIGLKKKRITSLAYVVDANHASEYKFKNMAMSKDAVIERTTKLPPNYQAIANELNVKCNTYGDLSFILKSADSELDRKLLDNLKLAGLDLDILKRVS